MFHSYLITCNDVKPCFLFNKFTHHPLQKVAHCNTGLVNIQKKIHMPRERS